MAIKDGLTSELLHGLVGDLTLRDDVKSTKLHTLDPKRVKMSGGLLISKYIVIEHV